MTAANSKTMKADLFKKAVLLTVTNHGWRNRRKANMAGVSTDSDKNLLRLTKKLIEAEEYEEVMSYEAERKRWVEARCVPSYLQKGMYLVKTTEIENIDAALVAANIEIKEKLAPKLIKVYPACKEMAKQPDKLGSLYREEDYPSESALADSFGIEWQWIRLEVADNLPPKVKAKEIKKMQAAIREAQAEIVLALRKGFGELVERMVERLGKEEDGTPKKFKDSLVENFNEFFDTFDARNLMEDADLRNVVEQAKGILAKVKPESLRKNLSLRSGTQKKLAEVKQVVDELIKDAPTRRKLNFDNE